MSSEFPSKLLIFDKFQTHRKNQRFSGYYDVSCSTLAEHFLSKICSKYHFEKAPKLFSLLAQLIIYINSCAKREITFVTFKKRDFGHIFVFHLFILFHHYRAEKIWLLLLFNVLRLTQTSKVERRPQEFYRPPMTNSKFLY